MSTFAAEEKMIAMELTRKGKKRRIDALAAAEILQAFLDSKKSLATDYTDSTVFLATPVRDAFRREFTEVTENHFFATDYADLR